jgi:hypothetical protein
MLNVLWPAALLYLTTTLDNMQAFFWNSLGVIVKITVGYKLHQYRYRTR